MKTAVITGASGGIGLALTKTFIKNGYFVIAQYNANEKPLLSLKEELLKDGLSDYLFCAKVDLSKDNGASELFSIINKSFKKINLLINNAGMDLYKLCEETETSELDKVINVNFRSAYQLTSRLIPLLKIADNPSIINISSVWGEKGACMETAYSATKSALIGLTKALSKELAPQIRVNCVTPGVIDTPMNACFSKEEMREIIKEIPMSRLGKPSEVASLCLFLASNEAGYITGATIPINGGYGL